MEGAAPRLHPPPHVDGRRLCRFRSDGNIDLATASRRPRFTDDLSIAATGADYVPPRYPLPTPVASTLEAEELAEDFWNQRFAVWPAHHLKIGVLCDGSPTGILDRRSYDPRKALRSVQASSAQLHEPCLGEAINFVRRAEDGCSIEVHAVPFRDTSESGHALE